MISILKYQQQIHALLSPAEHKLFKKLNTPQKVQDYLDTVAINFESEGETLFSPRQLIREKRAHCMEGALFAAAALAYHGRLPLLLDLQTIRSDEDHVVTLFVEEGKYWGAISKTNHSILRWRDPVYKGVRELAMSYFNEYVMLNGKRTLRAYSKPYDMRVYKPEDWVVSEGNLDHIAEELDVSPHEVVAPEAIIKKVRKASKLEVKVLDFVEWDAEKYI
jgi:hypothetical protein